jgi:phosphoribosylaminoimidazolecarboxamide formyltransferase/IMP cyclohydrolase
MEAHGIGAIDLVVIDLYPFENTIRRSGVTAEEAVEQIDIGGPAMIRSAAKNHESVAVIVSVDDYDALGEELRRNNGATSRAFRLQMAAKAFRRTATYDLAVMGYLTARASGNDQSGIGTETDGVAISSRAMNVTHAISPPDVTELTFKRVHDLRYGENPHQQAALYDTGENSGIGKAEVLSGKEMSYNNYVDADAAWQLVVDFEQPTCAIIKHTNPAGVGQGASPEECYRKALATDPLSAFGGIVAFNCDVDELAARAVIEIFTEVVIAPNYSPAAVEILKTKKNLRVLRCAVSQFSTLEYRQITGGMLMQTRDSHRLKSGDLRVVTSREPTQEELRALLFAWTVCKHTKSNAIVYARAGQTVGVGAGQMSRVDSVKLAAMRAVLPVAGSVLASDAFFPFRDGIDEAAKQGITAVIQPGGSVKDIEVISAANEHGLAMVFTGIRHFKH